jgi:WG containing repeat
VQFRLKDLGGIFADIIFTLNKAGIIILVSFWVAIPVGAQLDPVRHAQNRLEKGKWEGARSLLDKAIKRDSASVDARYVYSQLFINDRYPSRNIDSANYYCRFATALFAKASEKERGKLRKFPLDSLALSVLKFKIDSSAFEVAQTANSEAAYTHFILEYDGASQIPKAIRLRDEAAFAQALSTNTFFAFQDFMAKYPNSHKAGDAKNKFDTLLYHASTKNKTLSEYQDFVRQHPDSPFYKEALSTIFEMITLPGTMESFEAIIKQYPGSAFANLSKKIIFHLRLTTNQITKLPDSLQEMYPLRDWIAFNQNGLWGFMDEHGKVKVQASLQDIHAKYFCQPLVEDFIQTQGTLIARNKAIISVGHYSDVLDLGSGFLLAKSDSANFIIHKSGWKPLNTGVSEATIVSTRFLAIKVKSGWGLYSLCGRQILAPDYDKISELAGFILLTKLGSNFLVHPENVIDYSQGKWDPAVGDDIKLMAKKYFWIRNGANEKVLDEKLNEYIPSAIQTISSTSVGMVVKKDESFSVIDWPRLTNEQFISLQIAEPWMITRKLGEKPSLFYVPTQKLIQEEADSIWFDQTFATVQLNDSLKLWQSTNRTFTIPKSDKYLIRKGKDSTVYIIVLSKNRASVHNPTTFKKLFSTPYSDVQPVVNNFFLIKDKGKQGLINEKGKIILKPEYDAIVYANGLFSLLKSKKFGSYVPSSKKLIAPNFDSNLLPYSKGWIIARKENKLAFLKGDGTNHTAFDFDEIEYWSDTVALTKKAGKRSLYSIKRMKVEMDNIAKIQPLPTDRKEPIAIIRQNNRYGLIGNASGILIKPEYEELNYQLVNSVLIFIGIKPEIDGRVEFVHLHSSGQVIKRETLSSKLAYQLICDE